MPKIIIEVRGGTASVVYSDNNIESYIFDFDNDDLYLYNNLICIVDSVNDDGTINLTCIDDDSQKRRFLGIDPSSVDWYGSDSEII